MPTAAPHTASTPNPDPDHTVLCSALAKETRAHNATKAKLAALEAELAKTKQHLKAAKFGREKTTKQYKYLFKLIRDRLATGKFLKDADDFESFEKPHLRGTGGRVTLHKDYVEPTDPLEAKVQTQFEEAIRDGLTAHIGLKRRRVDTSLTDDIDA